MYKTVISSISERGVFPVFYAIHSTKEKADDYTMSYIRMAAKCGLMIRVDRETVR